VLITAIWVTGLVLFNRFFCTQNLDYKILTVKLVGITVMVWILVGISFIMIFDEISFNRAGLSVGGFALSWAVGYVAFFAPGGIGVRETVLAAVFSIIAPPEQIAVYAAMNRIVWVMAELLLGLVFSLKADNLFKQQAIPAASTVLENTHEDVISPVKTEKFQ
jgi:hypothetical protein